MTNRGWSFNRFHLLARFFEGIKAIPANCGKSAHSNWLRKALVSSVMEIARWKKWLVAAHRPFSVRFS